MSILTSHCTWPQPPWYKPIGMFTHFQKSLRFSLLGLCSISFAWKPQLIMLLLKACLFFRAQEALKCHLLTENLPRVPQLRDLTNLPYIFLITVCLIFLLGFRLFKNNFLLESSPLDSEVLRVNQVSYSMTSHMMSSFNKYSFQWNVMNLYNRDYISWLSLVLRPLE